MRENDGLADSQPKAVSWDVRVLRCLFAEKRFENPFAVLHGDTRSLIVDGVFQFAIAGHPS
jgi:hypothetical protein